jgi:hypothetical protein
VRPSDVGCAYGSCLSHGAAPPNPDLPPATIHPTTNPAAPLDLGKRRTPFALRTRRTPTALSLSKGAAAGRASKSSARTGTGFFFYGMRCRTILEPTLTLSLLLFLSGCGTAYLQPPADPPDPRAVFVVDHGRHTSLVLVTDAGNMVRYAYGDWRYYADQDTRLRSGVAALFCRTPSTLARREFAGPPEETVLLERLRVGVQTIHLLEVRGADADRLRAELDALHEQGADRHQYVAVYDLVFAPHPEPYSWRNNSATKIGEWLEEMGVGVRGQALVSRWEVLKPQ